MKMSKALKILFITHSLLLSTAPSYAQAAVEEERGLFQRFKDYLFSRDSSTSVEDDGFYASNANGKEDSNSGAAPSSMDFVFCGQGAFQEIHLNGISELINKFDGMCKAEVSQFYDGLKERGLIGFCAYASKKMMEGGCYGDIGSFSDINNYEKQLLEDPYLRRKFIELEKEQLKKERDRMVELSSFQLLFAQDTNTLLQMKAELQSKLRKEGSKYAENMKNIFDLDDAQVEKIRTGDISISELSDAVFQCKPDNSFRTGEGALDQNILGSCRNDDENSLVQEAYDELVGIGDDVSKKGLLSDRPSELLNQYNAIISDDYKGMLEEFDSSSRFSDNEKSRFNTMRFQEDTNKMLSFMDIYREDGKPFELSTIVSDLIKNEPNPQVRARKANQASLRVTFDTLSRHYNENSTGKKMLESFKANYISETDDGMKFDFKGESFESVVNKIQSSLEEGVGEPSDKGVVKEFTRWVVAGSNIGAQMVISTQEQKKIGDEVNSVGMGLSSTNYSPFAEVFKAPKHPFLKRVAQYFKTGREAYDLNIMEPIKSMDNSTTGVCKTAEANTVTFKLNLIEALAQDCNKLTKRKKEVVASRHCPNAGNPRVTEMLLNDYIKNPGKLRNKPEDAIRDIFIGCKSVNMEAIIFNRSEDMQRDGSGETNLEGNEVARGIIEGACGPTHGPPDQASAAMQSRLPLCDAVQRDGSVDPRKIDKIVGGYVGLFDTEKGQARVETPKYPKSSKANTADPIKEAYLKSIKDGDIFSTGNYSTANKIKGNYNGKASKEPSYIENTESTSSVGGTYNSSGGINSNIFDTKKSFNPIDNRSFVPTINQDDGLGDVSSEELKSEMISQNGSVDPQIQKILDRMSAMEARERELINKQSQLLAEINSPSEGPSSDDDSEAKRELASVTKELEELKKMIPGLASKAREKNSEVNQRTASNFIRPSAVATPSNSSKRGTSSGGVNSAAHVGAGSSFAGSTSGGGGSFSSATSGQSYTKTGGRSSVSIDGVSAPAYTQKETFVLTQSIRDKAELVAAGVSIEDAVLQSKGAILVPYGNGEYMYVEPELNINGDVETRDGRVVYKEVLKVSDPKAIAEAKGRRGSSRAPASIEEVDPDREIYSWETFSKKMDEAQR